MKITKEDLDKFEDEFPARTFSDVNHRELLRLARVGMETEAAEAVFNSYMASTATEVSMQGIEKRRAYLIQLGLWAEEYRGVIKLSLEENRLFAVPEDKDAAKALEAMPPLPR